MFVSKYLIMYICTTTMERLYPIVRYTDKNNSNMNSKNKTSKYRGVSWSKTEQRWMVNVSALSKYASTYVATYNHEGEAHMAQREVENAFYEKGINKALELIYKLRKDKERRAIKDWK